MPAKGCRSGCGIARTRRSEFNGVARYTGCERGEVRAVVMAPSAAHGALWSSVCTLLPRRRCCQHPHHKTTFIGSNPQRGRHPRGTRQGAVPPVKRESEEAAAAHTAQEDPSHSEPLQSRAAASLLREERSWDELFRLEVPGSSQQWDVLAGVVTCAPWMLKLSQSSVKQLCRNETRSAHTPACCRSACPLFHRLARRRSLRQPKKEAESTRHQVAGSTAEGGSGAHTQAGSGWTSKAAAGAAWGWEGAQGGGGSPRW